jgi:hypothetical protein
MSINDLNVDIGNKYPFKNLTFKAAVASKMAAELLEEVHKEDFPGQNIGKVRWSVVKLHLALVELEKEIVFANHAQLHGQESSETEEGALFSDIPSDNSSREGEEIEKVANRLKRWAHNSNQINSRILQMFLKLKFNNKVVTVEQMSRMYWDGNKLTEFFTNFNQMKIIAPKNHGKVFEVVNNEVNIWEPVGEFVKEFAQKLGLES